MAREAEKQYKKRKAQEERERKKEESKKDKAAKAAKKSVKRKSDADEAEGAGEGEDDEDPHKKRKGITRTRGTFLDTDPPVLVQGHDLPAQFQVPSQGDIQTFIEEVVQNNPCILKLKKGTVKKIITAQTKGWTDEKIQELNQFANNQSKAFSATQASMAAFLKKAAGPVRKNSTVVQTKEVAMFLGFDMLLNGLLQKTPKTDMPEGAVVVEREHLVEMLVALPGWNLF